VLIHTDDRPISFTMETGSPTERVEPISLTWSKLHLRFPFTREDTNLKTYLSAARTHFEEITGRQCIDATWEYALDATPWQRVIEVPRPPFAELVSFVYDDASGVEQTVDPDTYRVLPSAIPEGSPADMVFDPYCPCGRIELVTGASWPTTRVGARCLRIRRTCGYGNTTDAMPPMILLVLGTLAMHFFERASEKFPAHIDGLLHSFKYAALPSVVPTTWSENTWL